MICSLLLLLLLFLLLFSSFLGYSILQAVWLTQIAGNELTWGEVFLVFQTVHEFHLASSTIGNGSFPNVERPQLGVKQEPRSSAEFRMS